MILWLHKILNQRSNIFGEYLGNWVLVITFIFIYNLFPKVVGEILIQNPVNLWNFVVPIAILTLGVFNYPYCYLKNIIKLKITSKIFKGRFYIKNDDDDYGDFKLSSNPSGAKGILVNDLIYLDEGCSYLILWGMKDRIRYFNEFEEFLSKEIKEEDNSETIKRKLILKNLTT